MKVHVLSINNDHGCSNSLYVEKSRAFTELHKYVKDYWDDGCGEDQGQMPMDMETATDIYFEYMDGVEWYSIEVHTLAIDPPKIVLEDEVELNEDEIEATISSLQSTVKNLVKLGNEGLVGEEDKELHTMILKSMESACKKLKD